MKKIINRIAKITMLLLFTASFTSCLLDDEAVDFGKGPVLVQFENSAKTAIFLKGGATTVYTYDVPVVIIGGDNSPLSKDVEISFEADASSTAVDGNQYTFAGAKTATLKAGETSVNVQISVDSDNLDPFDPKTLVLKITSSSEVVSENATTSILLQAACTLDLNSFVGTYTAVNARYANPLTVTVALGPAPNTLSITNVDGVNGTTVIELSTDVTNPTITYRSQEFDAQIYNHSTYGGVWATTLTPEHSNYNSCDNSMTLEFKRCVSIGCFGGSRHITMTKN